MARNPFAGPGGVVRPEPRARIDGSAHRAHRALRRALARRPLTLALMLLATTALVADSASARPAYQRHKHQSSARLAYLHHKHRSHAGRARLRHRGKSHGQRRLSLHAATDVIPSLWVSAGVLHWTATATSHEYLEARSDGTTTTYALVVGTSDTPPLEAGAIVTYQVRPRYRPHAWSNQVKVSYPGGTHKTHEGDHGQREREALEAKERAEREAKERAEREAKELAERQAREKAEREAKEKAEREAKERAEREAKEKAEREAKERAEREAKERAEREAKERAEREAKERAEREAREKAEREAKERAEREAKERAEREAKERAEREAKEQAEREAKERAEREAKEKAEREAKETAKEKAEREAREKAEREKTELEAKEKAEREAKEKAELEAKEKVEREQREREEREQVLTSWEGFSPSNPMPGSRRFGDLTSPWNKEVGPSPTIVPRSAEMVAMLLSESGFMHAIHRPGEGSRPMVYARNSDPVLTIEAHDGAGTLHLNGRKIHVPAYTEIEKASDGHLTVVLAPVDALVPSEALDFWKAKIEGGALKAASVGSVTMAGSELMNVGGGTGDAAYFALQAGLVREPELAAGTINHALTFHCAHTSPEVVYPARVGDGSTTPGIPMGQRFYLAYTDAEISALGFKPWKAAILRALAHYGMYLGDTGSEPGLYWEGSTTYPGVSPEPFLALGEREGLGKGGVSYELAPGVDWSRLRAIAPPPH